MNDEKGLSRFTTAGLAKLNAVAEFARRLDATPEALALVPLPPTEFPDRCLFYRVIDASPSHFVGCIDEMLRRMPRGAHGFEIYPYYLQLTNPSDYLRVTDPVTTDAALISPLQAMLLIDYGASMEPCPEVEKHFFDVLMHYNHVKQMRGRQRSARIALWLGLRNHAHFPRDVAMLIVRDSAVLRAPLAWKRWDKVEQRFNKKK